jgi:hypothetical protein
MNDEITEVVLKKVGDLSIGLCYEGDWKAKSRIAGNGKRLFCLDSEKWMAFLKEKARQICPILHPTLRIVEHSILSPSSQAARLESRQNV